MINSNISEEVLDYARDVFYCDCINDADRHNELEKKTIPPEDK